MHEYIEIRFRRKGKPFRLKREVSGGVEFDEPNPLRRTLHLGFSAADPITEYRLSHVRQIQGWGPGRFRLRVSVEDGLLRLRGVDEHALPEGRYKVTVELSDARVVKQPGRASVPHDGHAAVTAELRTDDRTIQVNLTSVDPEIKRVLGGSVLDGQPATDWLRNADIRPTRRAAVLNILAQTRVTPGIRQPLLTDVLSLFRARDDRAYAKVNARFYHRVDTLADRPDLPVYREGHPTASIHQQLLAAAGEDEPAAKSIFTVMDLWSFRAEGRPSLQMVVANPKAGFDHTFADLDLDLGNPLQDLVGLFVHVGELVSGKTTNHLDLRARLARGRAKAYLYYTVRA